MHLLSHLKHNPNIHNVSCTHPTYTPLTPPHHTHTHTCPQHKLRRNLQQYKYVPPNLSLFEMLFLDRFWTFW